MFDCARAAAQDDIDLHLPVPNHGRLELRKHLALLTAFVSDKGQLVRLFSSQLVSMARGSFTANNNLAGAGLWLNLPAYDEPLADVIDGKCHAHKCTLFMIVNRHFERMAFHALLVGKHAIEHRDKAAMIAFQSLYGYIQRQFSMALCWDVLDDGYLPSIHKMGFLYILLGFMLFTKALEDTRNEIKVVQ